MATALDMLVNQLLIKSMGVSTRGKEEPRETQVSHMGNFNKEQMVEVPPQDNWTRISR